MRRAIARRQELRHRAAGYRRKQRHRHKSKAGVVIAESRVITTQDALRTGRLKRRWVLPSYSACVVAAPAAAPSVGDPYHHQIGCGNLGQGEGMKCRTAPDQLETGHVQQPGRCQRLARRARTLAVSVVYPYHWTEFRMNILRGAVIVAFVLAVAAGLPSPADDPVDVIRPGTVHLDAAFEGDRRPVAGRHHRVLRTQVAFAPTLSVGEL